MTQINSIWQESVNFEAFLLKFNFNSILCEIIWHIGTILGKNKKCFLGNFVIHKAIIMTLYIR